MLDDIIGALRRQGIASRISGFGRNLQTILIPGYADPEIIAGRGRGEVG